MLHFVKMLYFHIFCVNLFIFFKIKILFKNCLLFIFSVIEYTCKSVEETES